VGEEVVITNTGISPEQAISWGGITSNVQWNFEVGTPEGPDVVVTLVRFTPRSQT
jgi:hypothetical protein